MVGMKSGNMDGVGQKWITFQAGSDPYGFVRDGLWHTVEIPIADLKPEVDLSEVSQLFQILGTSGPIPNIELDDIYFAGGASLQTNVVSSVTLDGVGISWPSLPGTNYTLQWTANLTPNAWTGLAPTIVGDGTTKTLFDPIRTNSGRFYRVLQSP
jgi:hypothetical protein